MIACVPPAVCATSTPSNARAQPLTSELKPLLLTPFLILVLDLPTNMSAKNWLYTQ